MNDYYACIQMMTRDGRYAEYVKGYGYCQDLVVEQLKQNELPRYGESSWSR